MLIQLTQMFLLYRNHTTDTRNKSAEWVLCGMNFALKRDPTDTHNKSVEWVLCGRNFALKRAKHQQWNTTIMRKDTRTPFK